MTPRLSFGMIVLNGEPFVRYNLRALYPFAHEIIVVEGATPHAASIATPDGHSTDGTLETLYRFKQDEDPDDKLIIVTRDGFWEGEKNEMSRAYAERVTGDYLWQIDCDEFYQADDMRAVLNLLASNPEITAMSFKQIQYWGGKDYFTDGWYLRRGAQYFHRLFKWGPGFSYATHRPPTVVDAQGRDLRTITWITGQQLERMGIFMYHYSLVFPKQVQEKSDYYTAGIGKGFSTGPEWLNDVFFTLRDPYHIHNVYRFPSWLERYRGTHPEQIEALWHDIQTGSLTIALRPTDDIEALLNSRRYQFKRWLIKAADHPVIRASVTKRLVPLVRRALHSLRRRLREARHALSSRRA